MSKGNGDEIKKLLAKAAMNAAARDALLKDPVKVASSRGIKLGKSAVAQLKKLRKDLLRFGGQKGLNKTDAKSWAIGLCQVRSVFKP